MNSWTRWGDLVAQTLRALRGRPKLTLYVHPGDPLSNLVARQMRELAEQQGYRVRERRL